jgi:rhodanese-related sulfurtransferase
MKSRKKLTLEILIIAVTGLLPLALYWFLIGSAPTVTADEAIELLATGGRDLVLVDVRDPESYRAEHLVRARNWPYKDILAVESAAEIPNEFRGKRLLLICDSGITSALAARNLAKHSTGEIFNIKGGLQAWIAKADESCPPDLCRFQTASGERKPLPYRESSLFEQWTVCFAAFGAKPLYIMISFMLAYWLRRSKSADLVALKWALIYFFLGEVFCAFNYLFFNESSFLMEYLHSFGMVLAFGYTTYAIFEGLDARVIRYSAANEGCALLGLCDACIKFKYVPCGLRRVFKWLAFSFVILGFMPLVADFHPVSYNTTIVGTLYNYSHSAIYQVFEIRYAPALAIHFFLAAFLVLQFSKGEPVPLAKVLFSAGMGFYGFSMFRLILLDLYLDNLVWFVCWEEFTELLYVAIIGIVLWIFRARLFREEISNP